MSSKDIIRYLYEARDYPLFHMTKPKNALSILQSDTLKGGMRAVDKFTRDKKVSTICFTRNPSYSVDYYAFVRFEFDANKLHSNYKLEKYDFYYQQLSMIGKSKEEEERIYTDEIKNISRYINSVALFTPGIDEFRNYFNEYIGGNDFNNLKYDESYPPLLNVMAIARDKGWISDETLKKYLVRGYEQIIMDDRGEADKGYDKEFIRDNVAKSKNAREISNKQVNFQKEKEIKVGEIETMALDITQYKIPEETIRRENAVSMFRRGDFDHNEDLQKHLGFYKDKVEEFLNKCPYENINNKLIAKFEKYCRDYTECKIKYLNHRANNPSWAVTGRSGLNKARYDKMQDRQDALISNLNTADEMIEKALRNARLDFEKLSKQDEKDNIANFIANNEMPKFVSNQVNIPGDGLKRGQSLAGYTIIKNWGAYRIYSPSGQIVHSMKTNETQKQAKEWLFYYVSQNGLLKDAQQESTDTKKMKKTVTKVIREDGDFRLIERNGGFTIQNHSTGKWLVYKESTFGSFSNLTEDRAKMYYTYIMLVGGYMTFKRHEVTEEMYAKKKAELFGDKKPVETDNDVKTENPQPQEVNKNTAENSTFVQMFKNVTGIEPQVSQLGVISVKLKDGNVSKKLAINSRTMMAIVGIPWEDDIASFNIFCKDSELFAAMKKYGFTMTVAKQNSEKEFMFSMKVGHKASIGNWDTNVVNVDENVIREFWSKVTRAAADAHRLVEAYKSVSLEQNELYHLSPKENRESILKDGILSTLAGQREGNALPGTVYVVNDVEALVAGMSSFARGEFDIFKIKGNYKLKPDFYEPLLAGVSFYIRDSIDPEDIELIGYVRDGVRADIEVEDEPVMSDFDDFVDDIKRLYDLDNLVFEIDGHSIDIHFKRQMDTITTIDGKEYSVDRGNLDDIIKQLKEKVPHIQIFKDNRSRDINNLKELITVDEIDNQFYDVQDIVELDDRYQIVYKDNNEIKAYMNVYFTKNIGDFVVDFKIIENNLDNPHFSKLQCMNKTAKETILNNVQGSTLSRRQYMYDRLADGMDLVINDMKQAWVSFKGVVDDIQQFIDEDIAILEDPNLYKVNLEDLAYKVIGIRPSRVNKAGSVQYDNLPTGNDKFKGKMKISDKKVIASLHTRFEKEELAVVSEEHLSTLKALGYESKNTDFYMTQNVKDIEKELPDIWEDFNNALIVMNDIADDIVAKSIDIEPELRHQEYKIETAGCSLFIKASSIGNSQAVIDTMEIKNAEGRTVNNVFGVNSYLSMVQDREEELRRFLEHDYWKVVSEFIETGRGNKLLVAKVELDKELAIKEKEAYWNDIRQQIQVKTDEVDREKDNAVVVFNVNKTRARVLIPIGPLGPTGIRQVENALNMFDITVSTIQQEIAHYGNVHELEGLPMANEPKWRPHGVQTATVDLLDKVLAHLKANKQTPVNQPKEVDSVNVEDVKQESPKDTFNTFKDTSISGDSVSLSVALKPGGSKLYRLTINNTDKAFDIERYFTSKGYFKGEDGFLYKEVFTNDRAEQHNLIQQIEYLDTVLNPEKLRAAQDNTPKPEPVGKEPKAETMPKISMVSKKEQKEQLKRLQTIAKKFTNDLDADPNINLIFLEEPREFKKFKLPTVAIGLICYDMTRDANDLKLDPIFKRFKAARGTSMVGKWFVTDDGEGRPCRMVIFVDREFEKASDENHKLIRKLDRRVKMMESVGQYISVCGKQMLLEAYDFETATFNYDGKSFTLSDNDMFLYETTQSDAICVDTKKEDMIEKALNKRRKLKVRKKK